MKRFVLEVLAARPGNQLEYSEDGWDAYMVIARAESFAVNLTHALIRL